MERAIAAAGLLCFHAVDADYKNNRVFLEFNAEPHVEVRALHK